MEIDEVVQRVDDAGLRFVRFLWCGNDGTVRAKASSRHGLEGRLTAGIGLAVGMQAVNSLDQLQPVEGMGPPSTRAGCSRRPTRSFCSSTTASRRPTRAHRERSSRAGWGFRRARS